MTELSRFVDRPANPEVFGLSTLDTVSCALGGAIILMILMSSFIERGAQVTITEYRQIFQKGVGEPAPPPRDTGNGDAAGADKASKLSNLATLFLDFEVTGAEPIKPKPTRGSPDVCKNTKVSILKPPKAHYPGEDADGRSALVIWADKRCTKLTIDLDLDRGRIPPRCTATLVTGAHFQVKSFAPCLPRFRLRGAGNQVFVFRRAP